MNKNNVVASVPARRRLGRLAIGFAILSLAFVIAAVLSGGQLRWWQISLPLLLIGNVAVISFGVFKDSPRLSQAYFVASFGIAIAVIAAIVMDLVR